MTLYESDQRAREIAAKVAVELGEGWRPDVQRDQDWGHGAHLRQGNGPDADAPRLAFGMDDWRARGKGRLSVHGSWPPERHPYPYQLHLPSITVAASKPAAQIARDIRRRLLPEYFEGLAKVIANNEQDRQNTSSMAATAERLAAALRPFAHTVRVSPDQDRETNVYAYLDESGGHRMIDAKVNYKGTEVSLELRWFPADQAVNVVRALEAILALEVTAPVAARPARAIERA